ncbi:hypothetical protein ACLB2K_048771 [Fragaria x ananassa]
MQYDVEGLCSTPNPTLPPPRLLPNWETSSWWPPSPRHPSALNLFCSYKIVGSLVVITLVSKLGAVRLCFRFRLLWPYRASLQFDIDAVALPIKTTQTLLSCMRSTKLQGLEILAFPCNQFGAQEPGSNDESLVAEFTVFDKQEYMSSSPGNILSTVMNKQLQLIFSGAAPAFST